LHFLCGFIEEKYTNISHAHFLFTQRSQRFSTEITKKYVDAEQLGENSNYLVLKYLYQKSKPKPGL